MIGRIVAHYRITEPLGSGGMGSVYIARDEVLGRLVVLKFLLPHLNKDTDAKKRLLREGKAASALDHANICSIYEVGTTEEGELFIAMAYYDGPTLREHIRGGPLSVEESVDIAIQFADGLSTAHDAGVVHRDLKPENAVIVNAGELKILDFGLAAMSGVSVITKEGSTLGTAAYMSPEQVRSEKTDRRSDIWSVGVMLYEMLAGRRPFAGDYDAAVAYSILNTEPDSLTSIRDDIPDSLIRVISRMLHKEADKRYQECSQLLADLRAIKEKSSDQGASGVENPVETKENNQKRIYAGVGILAVVALVLVVFGWRIFERSSPGLESANTNINQEEIIRLAVLPFSNLRPDSDTDYLGLSLAIEVISNLQYLENITVRPAASVRKYEGQNPDLNSVAEDLDVGYILAANFLKEGDFIRIDVELVDIQSNESVWADQLQVLFENAFDLRDQVATAVIDGLKIQFSPQERIRMLASAPSSAKALEYFLRARAQPNTLDGNTMAIELLNRVLELDDSFAPAYAERGVRTFYVAQYGLTSIDENIEAAEADYDRALSLNPELLDALGTLSMLKNETAQSLEAVRIAMQVLEINPNDALAHFAIGYALRYNSLLEQSAKWMNRAIELDPSQVKFRSAVTTFLYLGQFERALEVVSVDDGDIYELWFRGYIHAREGNFEAARSYFDQVLSIEQSGIWFIGTQITLAWMNRDPETVDRYAETMLNLGIRDGEAMFYTAYEGGDLLDIDIGIKMFTRAVDLGHNFYSVMENDPLLERYRSYPEFLKLIERARAASDEFVKGLGELALPEID